MADDVASLGFAVDSSQLVAASKALDQVNASAQRLAPSQTLAVNASQRLNKEQQLMANGSRAVTRAQAELGDKIDLLTKNTDAAYRSLSTRSFFRLLAREAGMLSPQLASAIQQFGILNVGGQRLGVGVTAAAIGIGALAGAMKLLVDIMKSASTLSQTAQISNIGGQQIQGLIAAAGNKGIGSGDVLSSMVELNKQVELAKLGLGSLNMLFKANGIAATTTEQAWFKIADLVKASTSQREKQSIIEQAGLQATVQMVTFLNQGGDAIRRQANESKKLTDAQLQQFRELEEQWNKMWGNFERWGKAALVNTGNSIQDLFIPDRTKEEHQAWVDARRQRRQLQPSDRINRAFDDLQGDKPPLAVTVKPEPKPVDVKTSIEQLELEKQRIQVLGQTASVAKEVRLAEIDLQIAGLKTVGVTKEQRDSLLELARERALGITGIKAQIDSTNVQAATMFMGAGAAAEYTAKQTILNEAIRNHKKLEVDQIADIERTAKALGEATSAARKMQQAMDLTQTFASGFFTDISHGVATVDALRNALTRLADSLIDMATKQLVKQAFGALIGGGFGGLFGGVGGGVGGGFGKAAVAHSGGIVGQLTQGRYIHPAYFDNAPRFGSGGIVGGERAVIAHDGEGIFTKGQMAAMGGGGVTIHFEVDARGADPGSVKQFRAEMDQLKTELPGIVLKANYEAKRRSVRT